MVPTPPPHGQYSYLKVDRILQYGGVVVSSNPKAAAATLVTGLALLVPASMGLLIAGVPTKLCPLPLLTIVPAFALSIWRLHYAAVLVPVLLFFLWHPGLFRGATRVPRRSYVLLAVAMALSIVYFIASWNLGLEFEGVEYTRVVCLVNVVWAAFLALAFARAWKEGSSFRASLFLHWMLFAWLAGYAFPYLGELP
jgi:hypothetical protein